MPDATFRIENVSIEGFKAFTTQQTLHFNGRHVFLFGPNGLGKTSIVEAIRWCLFGLASRRGEIVKNQFYAGPCIVQMNLRGPDGTWSMQRRLRPSGGESDLTIRDPNGSIRNLDEVFPQLSRIGPREGTHVIYAAQQPSSRRPEADITDFSYVVYRYLGLEEVPRLSDLLVELSKEWQIQEDQVFEAVDTLGEEISQRIAEVEENLARISSDPPWGAGMTPTNVDTREKIDQLIREAKNLGVQCDGLDALGPADKIYETDTAITSFFSEKIDGLDGRITDKARQLETAESLLVTCHSLLQGIQEKSEASKLLQAELDSTLGGSDLEHIEKELQGIELDFETKQIILDIVQSSLRYLATVEEEEFNKTCPVCEANIEWDQLESKLKASEISSDNQTTELLKRRDQLKGVVSESKRLDGRLQGINETLTQYRSEVNNTLDRACHELKMESVPSTELLGKYIEETKRDCDSIKITMESQDDALRGWKTRTANLNRELRFHELRGIKNRLQRLYDVRYTDLHETLRN